MRALLRGVGIAGVLVVGAWLALGLLFGGLDWLAQGAYHLVAGWALYLGRTVPKLTPNPAEFAVAGVALVVLTAGCHRLGGWLAPPLFGTPWRWRWTLRAVALVVLLFACGTAAVGVTHQTAWLVRSPGPLTESAGGIRFYAARSSAMNNLKQLGLAAHTIEATGGGLPAPTFTPAGRPLHSWHAHLLPYLEQEELYRRIDRAKPWTDPANRPAVETRVKVFQYPTTDPPADPTATDFAPNARLFDRTRTLQDFPLGASNTVLAGEARTDPRPWADPLNWRDPRRPLGTAGGYAGVGDRPVLVLMADGSVRAVTPAGWAPVMRGEPPGDD